MCVDAAVDDDADTNDVAEGVKSCSIHCLVAVAVARQCKTVIEREDAAADAAAVVVAAVS